MLICKVPHIESVTVKLTREKALGDSKDFLMWPRHFVTAGYEFWWFHDNTITRRRSFLSSSHHTNSKILTHSSKFFTCRHFFSHRSYAVPVNVLVQCVVYSILNSTRCALTIIKFIRSLICLVPADDDDDDDTIWCCCCDAGRSRKRHRTENVHADDSHSDS